MKTIGLFSIKGGVGKTAAAVNLAYLASRDYFQTLIWDLDPQAASTFYLRTKAKVRGGIKRLLEDEDSIWNSVQETTHPNLDVLPADTSYRKIDLIFEELSRPKSGLTKLLKPFTDEYDYLFLDCPPSLNLLSENIFRAVDVLVVPIIPTTLSVRTLEQLVDFCKKERIQVPILPFFSMVDRRKKLHKETTEALPKNKDLPRFSKASIPYSSTVEQMGEHQGPVASFARWTEASEAYERLWRDVKRIAGKP
jgi:cellulose biosynthesis protein BcsQ